MLRYVKRFSFYLKYNSIFFLFTLKRVSSMPIDIERPAPSRKQPLRRGIHITEHKDYRINPEPLVLQEADFLLEEFLSPTKLVLIVLLSTLFFNLFLFLESINWYR